MAEQTGVISTPGAPSGEAPASSRRATSAMRPLRVASFKGVDMEAAYAVSNWSGLADAASSNSLSCGDMASVVGAKPPPACAHATLMHKQASAPAANQSREVIANQGVPAQSRCPAF
jgi:hypothetical protein